MKPTKKPLVVGVTGIMGAGKTTVARVFEEMGATLVDADAMGKAMLEEPEIRDALVGGLRRGNHGRRRSDRPREAGRGGLREPRGSARTLDALTREPLIARIRARIEELRGRVGGDSG